jgi:hypothetical protein
MDDSPTDTGGAAPDRPRIRERSALLPRLPRPRGLDLERPRGARCPHPRADGTGSEPVERRAAQLGAAAASSAARRPRRNRSRARGLYPCQTSLPAFDEANRAQHSPIYRDAALFSPRVPFFRDDDGRWLDAVVLASVITCPAPNASALRQQHRFDAGEVERALRRRAEFVLAIARHHAIDHLVLGAWGAGVFGNDPAIVADAFRQALAGEYLGAFAEIVFAVLGDRASSAITARSPTPSPHRRPWHDPGPSAFLGFSTVEPDRERTWRRRGGGNRRYTGRGTAEPTAVDLRGGFGVWVTLV